MAELTIRPEEIRDAIEKYVSSYTPETTREEVGRVIETADGIARVEGLHSTMANELLEFDRRGARSRAEPRRDRDRRGHPR